MGENLNDIKALVVDDNMANAVVLSTLLERYGKGRKMTGTTILGRYISKMKLKQFKDYRWKDTEFLAQMAEKKLRDTMTAQGYSSAEIT